MPTVAEKESWPFLSIVACPEGWQREDVARLLAGPGGMDQATLRMRLGREPPMVLERIEPAAARAMAEALRGHGGDAFTFTFDDLTRPGPTLKIRSMGVDEGRIDLELWQGLSTALPFNAVQVLVRAHLSERVTVRREPPKTMRLGRRLRTWDMIKAEAEATVEKDVRTSDKLDLHTTDGSVYQVDGDRFSFEVLGDLRGHGDKANMDSLVELLAHLCPDAIVDEFFKLWRPPPGAQRLEVPHTRLDPEDATFEFYSRWAALTYRYLL